MVTLLIDYDVWLTKYSRIQWLMAFGLYQIYKLTKLLWVHFHFVFKLLYFLFDRSSRTCFMRIIGYSSILSHLC